MTVQSLHFECRVVLFWARVVLFRAELPRPGIAFRARPVVILFRAELPRPGIAFRAGPVVILFRATSGLRLGLVVTTTNQ